MKWATLDPITVQQLYNDCLTGYREDPGKRIEVECIMLGVQGNIQKVEFNTDRLESHKAEIEALLDRLPDAFRVAAGGGGHSMLYACQDRRGEMWTGSELHVEQLILLGVAIGKVEYQLPREVWGAVGGKPYILVR